MLKFMGAERTALLNLPIPVAAVIAILPLVARLGEVESRESRGILPSSIRDPDAAATELIGVEHGAEEEEDVCELSDMSLAIARGREYASYKTSLNDPRNASAPPVRGSVGRSLTTYSLDRCLHAFCLAHVLTRRKDGCGCGHTVQGLLRL